MSNALGIIPARYASTRFPGKPLAMINGKSMIQRVYEQAIQANLQKVVVATDDTRIYNHVKAFNGQVQMTAEKHQSGTDRCAEIAQKESNFDIVVNIQGDEPFIQPRQINLAISIFEAQSSTEIATLAKTIENQEELFNPNVVKVLFDKHKKAIYFSRQTIPYIRNEPQKNWLNKHDFYKHIGLYAYKRAALLKISKLSSSSFEVAESLEQLRWLQHGYTIGVALTSIETQGIDTPEDLKKIMQTNLR